MAFWQVSLLVAVALTAAQASHGHPECPPPDDHPECPPLWSRYGANCYRFFGQTKTWQAAEEHCRQFFTQSGRGHLASIHTQDEDDLLKTMSETTLSEPGFAWLGATDETVEGKFVWTDGTEFNYHDWRPNQPDNSGQEDCVHAIRDGWNDISCGRAYPYICQMPASQ